MRPVHIPALIVLGIALTTAACGVAGPAATPGPTTPSSTPNPTPTPVTQPNPRIDLTVAGDWDVAAVVTDRTGSLAKAESGTAGNTMSVRWFDAKVVNTAPTVLEVTWVGLPRNEEVDVEITGSASGLTINIVQAAPPLNSDAEGSDRVLVLTFDAPVAAETVKVTFAASNPS